MHEIINGIGHIQKIIFLLFTWDKIVLTKNNKRVLLTEVG